MNTGMAMDSTKVLLGMLCVFSCMLSHAHGRLNPSFRVKAVNLGGWLVTEGWIKPSLFDGIPNNDLLVCAASLCTLHASSPFLSSFPIGISFIFICRMELKSSLSRSLSGSISALRREAEQS